MVGFVMGTIVLRYALDPIIGPKIDAVFNPIAEKLVKTTNETSNPASSQRADEIIKALESRNNQLLKVYQGYTAMMTVFLGAALLYSIDQIFNKEKKSPALYVFVLSTLTNLIYDCLNLRKFSEEKLALFHKKSDITKIHSYFNDAVIFTKTTWVIEEHEKINHSVLTFSAIKLKHLVPRKINEIVKDVLEANGIPVVSRNNGNLLCVNAHLPVVKATKINSQIQAKIDELTQSADEKAPPPANNLTKEQLKKLKGKGKDKCPGFFENKNEVVKKTERVITLPDELLGLGDVVEKDNGSLMFIWRPTDESEVTGEDIHKLVGDNEYRIARYKGQAGIKPRADGILYYKSPSTSTRILLEPTNVVTIIVNGENQTIPAFLPTKQVDKNALRRR